MGLYMEFSRGYVRVYRGMWGLGFRRIKDSVLAVPITRITVFSSTFLGPAILGTIYNPRYNPLYNPYKPLQNPLYNLKPWAHHNINLTDLLEASPRWTRRTVWIVVADNGVAELLSKRRAYMQGQGDLVSRLRAPIAQIINPLTKSPWPSK